MCLFVASQFLHATSFKRTPAFQLVLVTYDYLWHAVINRRRCRRQFFLNFIEKGGVLSLEYIGRISL